MTILNAERWILIKNHIIMPGTTMNSSLKSTIDALKLAAVKTRQTKAIEDALEQLDSTPKLLVSHS
jgi:hypothetical protein